MTYPRIFEYRLHELHEADGTREALLRDMGDIYPELRPFFARLDHMMFDPVEVENKIKHIAYLEECVQGLENTAMFRDARIVELEDMLDRARTWQSAQAFSAFSEGYQHGCTGPWSKADPAGAWKKSKARAALELKKGSKP